jgi:hypothetical protein
MEDELVAAANLVAEKYEELKKKDPQNELLKFIEIMPTEIKYVPQHAEEFHSRFPPVNPNSGYKHPLYTLTNYYNALCRALGEPPGFAELTDELKEKYGLKK